MELRGCRLADLRPSRGSSLHLVLRAEPRCSSRAFCRACAIEVHIKRKVARLPRATLGKSVRLAARSPRRATCSGAFDPLTLVSRCVTHRWLLFLRVTNTWKMILTGAPRYSNNVRNCHCFTGKTGEPRFLHSG